MLEISGTLNGVQYKQENISVTDLIQALPGALGFMDDPYNVEFCVTNSASTSHRGQTTSVPLISIPAVFTAHTPNRETFTLRYYTSVRKTNDAGKAVDWEPRKLFIEFTNGWHNYSGRDLQRSGEMIAFLALHPLCATSPFAESGSKTRFRRHDAQAEATATIQAAQMRNEAVNAVISGKVDAFDMMNVAAGLGFNTLQPLVRIQASMMERAQLQPVQFSRDFYSEDIRTAGMVRRLIETNVLLASHQGGQVAYRVDPSAAAAGGQAGFSLNLGAQRDAGAAQAALINLIKTDESVKSALETMLRARTGQPAPRPKAAKVEQPEPEVIEENFVTSDPEDAQEIKPRKRGAKKKE